MQSLLTEPCQGAARVLWVAVPHVSPSAPHPPQPAHSAPCQVLPMCLSPSCGYFCKCQCSPRAGGWHSLLACLDGDMGQCTWS